MNPFIRLRSVLLLLLALFIPLVGSAQGSGPEVRTVYLTPDGPSINTYMLVRLAAGLTFGSASEATVVNPPGSFPYIVTRATDTTQVLFGATLQTEAGKRKNVLLLNTLDSIEGQVLDFDLASPTPAGKSYLRLLQASPNVDPVDIRITNSAGVPVGTVTEFDFKSTTNFIELPPGSTTVEVFATGSTTQLLKVSGNLAEKSYYTAILAGMAPNLQMRLLNESNLSVQTPMVLMQPPSQGIARLRVIHGVPDAPAFDLYVDGTKSAAGVSFRDASVSIPLAPGDHQVAITVAGTPLGSAFSSRQITLVADQEITVYALGAIPASLSVLTSTRSLTTSVPAGRTLVRVIHGMADLGSNIDVKLHPSDNQTLTMNGLVFALENGYQEVASGTFTIDVAQQGGVPIYRATGDLPSGGIVTIVATRPQGNIGLNMLIDSDTSRQAPMQPLLGLPLQNGPAAFRAVHVSPSNGNVSVVTTGSATPETLSYRDAGTGVEAVAGAFNVKVTSQGSGNINIDSDLQLKEDSLTTFFMMDNQSGGLMTVSLQTGQMSPSTGKSFLRLLPASPLSIPVDAELTFSDGSKHRFQNLAFGEATEYVEVTAGKTSLSIYAPGSSIPLITIDGELPAGETLTGVATGLISQGTLDLRVLIDTRQEAQKPMLPFATSSSVPAENLIPHGSLSIAPNPATSSTRLTWSLLRAEHVRVALYDPLGRLVRLIAEGKESQGEHTTIIATDGIPAGVYTVVVSGEKGADRAAMQVTVVK